MRDFHYFETLIDRVALPQPIFSKLCMLLLPPSIGYYNTYRLILLDVASKLSFHSHLQLFDNFIIVSSSYSRSSLFYFLLSKWGALFAYTSTTTYYVRLTNLINCLCFSISSSRINKGSGESNIQHLCKHILRLFGKYFQRINKQATGEINHLVVIKYSCFNLILQGNGFDYVLKSWDFLFHDDLIISLLCLGSF